LIFGLACFEKIGDARQTAGDVTRLRRLLRNARDHVADRHFRTVDEADERARGQRVDRRNLGVRERHFLALRVHELDGRTQIFAATLLAATWFE
jgi:hypothetical protein